LQPAAPSPSDAPIPPGAPGWRLRHLWRGALLFCVCTLVGSWLVRDRGTWRELLHALAGADPRWLALGAAQAALDALLGGARMATAARAVGGRVRLSTCIAANTANVFLGGVTPSQSGGGPAQIFLLVRGGLTVAEATVTSAATFLGTVVVFLGLAVHVGITANLPAALPLRAATVASVVVFAACAVAVALALPQPRAATAILGRLAARVPRWGGRVAASRAFAALAAALLDTHRLLRRSVRHGRAWLLVTLVLSAVVYLNKFAIGWVAIRALGLAPPLATVLQRFEVQALVSYFAPTPGASGIAEVSAAALLGDLVPAERLGACVLVWRLCGLYLEMAAGGIVVAVAGLGRQRAATRASMPVPASRR